MTFSSIPATVHVTCLGPPSSMVNLPSGTIYQLDNNHAVVFLSRMLLTVDSDTFMPNSDLKRFDDLATSSSTALCSSLKLFYSTRFVFF